MIPSMPEYSWIARLQDMSTREERAAARKSWPVKKVSLQDDTPPSVPADGQSGWDAVTELTWEAYSLLGPIPEAPPRSQWPSRLFKPGEPRPDSNGL